MALAVVIAACGADGGSDDDIVYLLPAEIPNGWTLRVATERIDPIPDYTVSWAPTALAGRDRAEAVAAPDTGPRLFINVGARISSGPYQGQLASNAASASIDRDGDVLSLDFVMSGSPVAVGGRDVTEDQLRRFATSLRKHDHDEWREALGERLLIDRPR